jgi:glycosyltransferase involved in cell wall biosynthesis
MLIVTNDGTNGDKIAELLRIRKSKFRMWLNGVDKEWLCNNERSEALKTDLGLTSDDFMLMCLSRLAGWKRQDRVISAMPLILKEIPTARLVIVGDGPKRQELEKMVRELNLETHVQFIGIIEHNKVRDMLGIADVFLQTNNLSCLGNTLLEAMVCGRAIVTWDVGTTRDVIVDGENGCLMKDAEPETIARTVIALAKEPQRRERLAQGARKFAEEHLQSWDERLNMEIDLIEQIRAGKSK